MKKTIALGALCTLIMLGACNSATQQHPGTTGTTASTDTTGHVSAGDDSEIKAITPSFTVVDEQVAASVKSIVDAYLSVKNALVADNPADAAKAASGIAAALKGLDKSLLTADQKIAFDAAENGIKTGAEGLEKQAADISAQRTHFYDLSQGVYALVKAFGGGRTLYHDHCPMARDNQGALWLSENKDVKNPYFGAEMLTCGTVEEVIN